MVRWYGEFHTFFAWAAVLCEYLGMHGASAWILLDRGPACIVLTPASLADVRCARSTLRSCKAYSVDPSAPRLAMAGRVTGVSVVSVIYLVPRRGHSHGHHANANVMPHS